MGFEVLLGLSCGFCQIGCFDDGLVPMGSGTAFLTTALPNWFLGMETALACAI